MMTPEGYEKKDIDRYLTGIHAFNVKPKMAGYGASGVPDRVVCIAGVFWGIEVKRDGKMPTALQTTRMNEIRAAGGMATWGTAFKVVSEIESWRSQQGLPPYSIAVSENHRPASEAGSRSPRQQRSRRSQSG